MIKECESCGGSKTVLSCRCDHGIFANCCTDDCYSMTDCPVCFGRGIIGDDKNHNLYKIKIDRMNATIKNIQTDDKLSEFEKSFLINTTKLFNGEWEPTEEQKKNIERDFDGLE